MATTKELIEALQKADPEGNIEVVIRHEDGWAYSVSSTAELVHCQDGEIDEDSDSPNCVKFDLI